jgi:hypothetical protein
MHLWQITLGKQKNESVMNFRESTHSHPDLLPLFQGDGHPTVTNSAICLR